MQSEKTPLKSGKLDAVTKAAWYVEDAVRGFPPRDLSNMTFENRSLYLLTEYLRQCFFFSPRMFAITRLQWQAW